MLGSPRFPLQTRGAHFFANRYKVVEVAPLLQLVHLPSLLSAYKLSNSTPVGIRIWKLLQKKEEVKEERSPLLASRGLWQKSIFSDHPEERLNVVTNRQRHSHQDAG